MNRKHIDTIKDVIDNDFCVGCGMCAAYNDDSSLVMKLDKYGAYLPHINHGDFDTSIDSQFDVNKLCPFCDGSHNEDTIGDTLFSHIPEIQHRSEIGYFKECFVGHVNDEKERMESTSGGIISWVAKELLKSNTVDSIICVTPTYRKEALFEYQIIDDINDIHKSRKSRYYPIEMSSVIKQIRKEDKHFAFIGLPCFVKSINLAKLQDPLIAEKVIYTIGLVCGHLKTTHYAAYLTRCCGMSEKFVNYVDFRKKAPELKCMYVFEATEKQNNTTNNKFTKMNHVFASSWSFNLFMLNACDFCDDVMSETADIAIGDAWLPEYHHEYRGTSIVICRNENLYKLLNNGIQSKSLNLEPISPKNVIKSQAGGLRHRRAGLSYRLSLMKNKLHPKKRVAPNKNLSLFNRIIQRIRLKTKCISKKAFLKQQSISDTRIDYFKRKLRPWVFLHNKLYGLRNKIKNIFR